MRRRQHRHDSHQTQIVAELRACGFSVRDTSMIGDDFPDLIIGKNGMDRIVELKSPKKIQPSAQRCERGATTLRR